jgi:L-ascorbate metabolism protein UlaG (beta-lactamase superfamily)
MSKQIWNILGCLLLVILLISACQPQPSVVVKKPAVVPVLAPPVPTVTPAGPKITLYYVGKSAQVELVSPQGIRVLIDVAYPAMLSSPPTEQDILLTTHHHADHFVPSFLKSFPGPQLDVQVGEISKGDVTIHSIMAEHAATNFGAASICPNAIYIVDMGGLRIVHFGDFGQEQLSPEQLAALGNVDVAISLLGDPTIFEQIMKDRTMFKLMAQVKPKLIIPTDHSSMDSVGYAAQQWQGFYSSNNPVTIERADLSGGTKFLVMGTLATSYQLLYHLSPWGSLAASQ